MEGVSVSGWGGHNVELGFMHQRVFARVMLYLLEEGSTCVWCLVHLH